MDKSKNKISILKKSPLILSIAFSMAVLASGAVITYASGYISYHNVEVTVDSETQTLAFGTHGSNTLYFKQTSVWNANSPKYYAYCWKKENDVIIGTQVFYPTTSTIGTGNDTIYVINAPLYSYTNCLFIRMSPNATGGSFVTADGFWNQTEDLSISSAYNMYTISSMTGGTDGKSNGAWSQYIPS